MSPPGYGAPPPPPGPGYGFPPPYAYGPHGYGFVPTKPGNGNSIGAIVLGVIAIFVCWPLTGGLALWLASRARDAHERGAKAAQIVAIVGFILGIVLMLLTFIVDFPIAPEGP